MYLSLSLPWGSAGTLSYNMTLDREENAHRVGYYNRSMNTTTIRSARRRTQRSDGQRLLQPSGRHGADQRQRQLPGRRYSAVGIGAQGGLTMAAEGAVLHRVNTPGGTRLLLDTEGVAGVPVRGYGSTVLTNRYGKAVADVNSYYRNKASIDLNSLSDNVEATRSVVQATLTEGPSATASLK